MVNSVCPGVWPKYRKGTSHVPVRCPRKSSTTQVKDRTKRFFVLGVILATLASITAENGLSVVRVAENWSRDLRVATLTPPQPQSEQIVIVTITDETLAALPYRSPLDRRLLSDLLRTLEDKGVRAIGIDLLLDQPSEPEKDIELQETLRTLSVPVVAAWAETSDGLTEHQVAFMASYLDGVRVGIPVISMDRIDGTVRSIVLRRHHEGRSELGFTAAMADLLGIPVPEGDTLTLRFRGAPDAQTPPFVSYPAHAVSLLPKAWFDGRIVLIGADQTLTDRHRTPFSVAGVRGASDMPGVLLHAHALSQILDGHTNPNVPSWQSALVAVAFAILGVLIVMFGLSITIKAAALLIATNAIWLGGSVLFQYSGRLVPLVTPTLSLAFAAALTYAWRWREEQVQRRFILHAFSKFVAPAIVNHMIEEPERLRLGGERRNMTFLFTDITNYTALTESTEPTLLVKIMNEYFEGTCDIVFEHSGTLEKIVGDALHVMFNAPLEQPDHEERAVRCALALDAYCQAFVSRQSSQGIEFGVTRIGVNTGVVVVGNFGGEKHFDYSATGDAINTAARLESANKQIGTRVCVSASTTEGCPDMKFRPIGELILKGKSKSVAALEPAAGGGRSRSNVDEYIAAYRLLSAEGSAAERAFHNLAEQYPEDALVGFHLERLTAGESGGLITLKEK
jgi:adenylate cyclase